jgi:hypothetical protein
VRVDKKLPHIQGVFRMRGNGHHFSSRPGLVFIIKLTGNAVAMGVKTGQQSRFFEKSSFVSLYPYPFLEEKWNFRTFA